MALDDLLKCLHCLCLSYLFHICFGGAVVPVKGIGQMCRHGKCICKKRSFNVQCPVENYDHALSRLVEKCPVQHVGGIYNAGLL